MYDKFKVEKRVTYLKYLNNIFYPSEVNIKSNEFFSDNFILVFRYAEEIGAKNR